MLRSSGAILMVLIATLIAVPAACAQTPVEDQYEIGEALPNQGSGDAPAEGGGEALPEDRVSAPVGVRKPTRASAETLPFTGAQVSLIALIGLAVIAVGSVGLALTRRRGSTPSS